MVTASENEEVLARLRDDAEEHQYALFACAQKLIDSENARRGPSSMTMWTLCAGAPLWYCCRSAPVGSRT